MDDPPATRTGSTPLTAAREPSGPATTSYDPTPSPPVWRGGRYQAAGAAVGPYRVVGTLGEGGMGVVYLAEQDAPVRREVALKLLRPGLGRADILARFEAERQALAVMEHPNITRVFDAGATEAGEPYFVMERVHGTPITAYADARGLTVPERVRLFRQVCAAVQHAHQKGVIHRDLKPSNVLVTEVDGRPHCKVIDFGIAKAIGADAVDAELTSPGMAVGTPAYMSPEQCAGRGGDVDTRADVYALGVMLYELLAGVRPYDDAALTLALGTTRTDVPAPSQRFGALAPDDRLARARARTTDSAALRHALAGDLDAVLLRALEPDRERRYPSASALADDLARYLRHEPVSAAMSTRAYRARKFVRRHRLGVGLSAALLVVLVAFAATAAVQARRLAAARSLAVARQAQAEGLIQFMLGDLHDRLGAIGRLDVLDAAGDRAMAYFAAVPESTLSVAELGRRVDGLRQLGYVRVDQGRLPDAALLFGQAISAGERLRGRAPLTPAAEVGLARAQFGAGLVDWRRGNIDAALAHLTAFVRASERMVARHPDSLSYRRELAYALSNIGSAREAQGDVGAALAAYGRVLEEREALLRGAPQDPNALRDVAMAYNVTGVAQRRAGRLAEAVASHQAEIATLQRALSLAPGDAATRRDLGNAGVFLAVARLSRGDVSGARVAAAAARDGLASLASTDPSNASWRTDVAAADNIVSQARCLSGDLRGALAAADASVSTLTAQSAVATPSERVVRAFAAARTARARALLALGRATDARVEAEAAADLAERAVARRPRDLDHRRVLADAELALGEVHAVAGDPAAASEARALALAAVDSVARATRQTDLLALRAGALATLRRVADARADAAELARRGYRHPAYLARMRAGA